MAMRPVDLELLALVARISEKPQIEKVTVDGISYKVYRWEGGTNVESPCSCFGSPFRAHSTEYCPWLKKRSKHVADPR